MTSFAFIFGVIPLVIAVGPGAEMRQAMGTAVAFGMLGVTMFGLLFTPVFYVVCRWLGGLRAEGARERRRHADTGAGSGGMRRGSPPSSAALALAGCVVGPNHRDPRPGAPAQAPFAVRQFARLHRRRAARALVEPVPRSAARLAGRRGASRQYRSSRRRRQSAPRPRGAARNPGRAAAEHRDFGERDLSDQEPGRRSPSDSYDAGLDVGYQIDLFGRISRAIQASRADAEAVQAAFDLTRITVAAETARAYADACSAGRQLAVARETLRIQEQTFDLTRRLFEGGRGTALETSQAGALLDRPGPRSRRSKRSAGRRLFRLCGADRAAASRFPARGRGLRERRRLWRGRSRSATAPPCSPAGRTSARPSGAGRGDRAGRRRHRRSLSQHQPWRLRRLDGGFAGRAGLRATASASASGRSFPGPSPTSPSARARIAQAEASAEGALAEFDGAWLARSRRRRAR